MVQTIKDQFFWLRRYCARRWLTVTCLLLLTYFGFHGLNGDRGYFARQDTQALLLERREILDSLRLHRQELASMVAAMAPGRPQADMVEQELYKLGYIKPGDVIVFRSELEVLEAAK